jgi:hypothetical protein
VPILLQKSFCITEHNFSGLWARRSNNHMGATSTGDEITGHFGGAFEDTSIGDCRLFRLLAEN